MSLFLSLLIALTNVAEAKKPADPCAKSKVQVDAFSGEQQTIYSAMLWTLTTTPTGSTWTLKVGANGAMDTVLPAGWTVSMRLEDGSTLDLHSDVDSPARMIASQYGVTTQWLVAFKMSPTLLHDLATKPIVAMRFDTGQGPQTWEGNDAFRKNIGEAFGCATTKLPVTP